MSVRARLLLGCLCLNACAPEAVSEPKAPTPLPAPAATPPEPPLELGAVPAPPELQGDLRFAAPNRDIATLAQLIPGSNSLVEALRDGPGPLLENLIGASLLAEVDLEQSLDIAIEGRELVMSLAIRELGSARDRIRDFAPQPKGRVVRFTYTGSARAPLMQCEAWPAAGAARHRLLCSYRPEMIERYGPYLTRTLARTPPKGAVSSSVSTLRMRQAVQDELNKASSGDAGEAAGRELFRELTNELDSLATDIRLEKSGVELGVELGLSGSKSLLAAALGSTNGTSALPAAFWQLPKSTDIAIYTRGAKLGAFDASAPKLLREMWKDVYSVRRPMTRASMDERVAATRRLFFTGGPLLFAYGHDRDAAQKALGASKEALEKQPARARAALSGWSALRFDEPIEHWRRGLTELIALFQKTPQWENARDSGASAGGARPTTLRASETYRIVAPTPGDRLPKDAFRVKLVSKPNPAYQAGPGDPPALERPTETHFWFVPDSGATWLFVSNEEKTALSIAHTVTGGAAEPKLGARSELRTLLAGEGALLGFVSLAGWVSLALDSETPDQLWAAKTTLDALASVPDGDTPVLLRGTPRGSGMRFSTTLSPAAIAGLFQWAMRNEGKP